MCSRLFTATTRRRRRRRRKGGGGSTLIILYCCFIFSRELRNSRNLPYGSKPFENFDGKYASFFCMNYFKKHLSYQTISVMPRNKVTDDEKQEKTFYYCREIFVLHAFLWFHVTATAARGPV